MTKSGNNAPSLPDSDDVSGLDTLEHEVPFAETLSGTPEPTLPDLDRYQILRQVGRGAFGRVYVAKHTVTLQRVAIKVVDHSGADPEAVQRLIREARAIAALEHPHIVRVSDAGVMANGDAFIAMEYIEGGNLADLIQREGKLPTERALAIMVQILDALGHAHAAGVVHRDVKPQNILLGALDRVKLVDFGVSKTVRNLLTSGLVTSPGMAIGTPGYMAPEQFGQAHTADARADIYSAAAVLYELITGHRPIECDSFEEWVERVRGGHTTPVERYAEGLPDAVRLSIERALSRDPDDRFASADDFMDALVTEATSTSSTSVAEAIRVAHENRTTLRHSATALAPGNSETTASRRQRPSAAKRSSLERGRAPDTLIEGRKNVETRTLIAFLTGGVVIAGALFAGFIAAVMLGRDPRADFRPEAAAERDKSGKIESHTAPQAVLSARVVGAPSGPAPGSTVHEIHVDASAAAAPSTRVGGAPTKSSSARHVDRRGPLVHPPDVSGNLPAADITRAVHRIQFGSCNEDGRSAAVSVVLIGVVRDGRTRFQLHPRSSSGDPDILRCVGRTFVAASESLGASGEGSVTLRMTWN